MSGTLLTPPANPVRDAAYYQGCHESNPAYQENNWLLDEMDRIAAFHASSVIELACGNGRFLDRAARHFATVYGCDWAVSPLLDRVLNEHANVAFFRTDLYTGLPPCRADLVVSADFLEHIAPDAVAGVIARIDTLAPKAFHKIACYDDGHSHLSVFEPRVWLELFHAADPGYRIEREEHRYGDPSRKIAVFVKEPAGA